MAEPYELSQDKKRLVCGQGEIGERGVFRSELVAAVISPRLFHQLTAHQLLQLVAPPLRIKFMI